MVAELFALFIVGITIGFSIGIGYGMLHFLICLDSRFSS